MIKSSKKTQTTVTQSPASDESVPVEKPTKDAPLAAKISYMVYRADQIVEPFQYGRTQTEARDKQLVQLRAEIVELAPGGEEFYKIAAAINNKHHCAVSMQVHTIPVSILKKYYEKVPYTALGSQTTGAVRTMISGFASVYASVVTIRDFLLDLEIYPTRVEFDPSHVLAPHAYFRDEAMFAGLRAALLNKDYNHNAIPTVSKTFTDLQLALLSPYCLQPRTVEVMHVMLVQVVTGRGFSYPTSETVPDSVVRRHYADQSYTLAHADIIELWRAFLLVCSDMRDIHLPVFTDLAFTEFLCTGQLTSLMSEQLTRVAEYALTRMASRVLLFTLGEKTGLAPFNEHENHPMWLSF